MGAGTKRGSGRLAVLFAGSLLAGALGAPGVAASPTVDPPVGAPPVAAGTPPADADRLTEDLEAALATKAGDAPLKVVARFAEPVDDAELREQRTALGDFVVTRRYSTTAGYAATLTKDQVEALAARPGTVAVEPDRVVVATMDTARVAFGVERAAVDFGVDGDAAGNGRRTYSPGDAVVAVLDTGIDASHVDLDGGKVVAFADFVSAPAASCAPPPPPGTSFDDQGHGTHVAGIVAGDGDATLAGGVRHVGVAPGAALVGLKVLDCTGRGSWSDVLAALDWVVANRTTYGIDVVNMSLGAAGSYDGTDSVSQAVNKLAAAGVASFVAAGNSGPQAGTVNAPGVAKFAVTVGAMADPGDATPGNPPGFALAPFSSRGPTADGRQKPDLVAAGVDVTAAQANSVGGYATKSGTSMATPFAAGVGALLLQADPALAPSGTACGPADPSAECADGVVDATMADPLKTALTSTAQDWGPPGVDPDYGAGRLDAYRAVDVASALTGRGGPPVPCHTFVSGRLAGAGASDLWRLEVTDPNTAVAVTVVTPTWSVGAHDFGLVLRAPSGADLAALRNRQRSEVVGARTTEVGSHTLEVLSHLGDGEYRLDVSGPATVSDPSGVWAGGCGSEAAQDGRYFPLPPARILDTRSSASPVVGPVGERGVVHLPVAGRGGVPATGVSAVVLNVTVTDTTAPSFLTVYPSGSAVPTTSNLNFSAGQTVPNLVTTKAGADGRVSLYNRGGSANLVVDVVGWFSDSATAAGGGRLVSLPPARILDTRSPTSSVAGPVGPRATVDVPVAGRGGVPTTGVAAVVLNVTVTDPTAPSFLTVYPAGMTVPTASNLNFAAGQTVPNLVVAKVGSEGKVSVYNEAGSAHVVVDVAGWFTDASAAAAGGRFTGIVPARILDTRSPTSSVAGPVGPRATVDVPVAGRGGVPATGVSAVVLNVTSTDATSPSFLTVFPAGAGLPTASNLNFAAGQTVPNLVVAKVGSEGKVSVYNEAGSAHVVVDVAGWFS